MASTFKKRLHCYDLLETFQVSTDSPILTISGLIDSPPIKEVEFLIQEQKNYKSCGSEIWKNEKKPVIVNLHQHLIECIAETISEPGPHKE